jgi:hypothetical protein
MELWNEYEGRSIDGLFPLEKLLRPEGRSAFFSTTSDSGTSTVIRLIESHFDEEEILARWTGVSSLRQPNLLALTRFGHAMMDETSLVYVVLEPAEADLGQILCERALTLAETRQVAASLVPALQALHAKGFIHEHIEPANVLAVGEVVKLRSDCIREAPEGQEGDLLRARDVQNLATLLLQSLTQQITLATGRNNPPLPSPFREIIENGLAGTWGLSQMAAALNPGQPASQNVREIPGRPLPSTASSSDPAASDGSDGLEAAVQQSAATIPGSDSPAKSAPPSPYPFPERAGGRIRVPVQHQAGPSPRWLTWLAVAVFLLLVAVVWSLVQRHGKAQANTPSATVQQPAVNNPGTATAAQSSSATNALPAAAAAPADAQRPHEAWRVVAYTYNKQSQAAAKAQTLQRQYSSLHPEVFSPTGRAPFLVTLGGPLSREAAFALKNRLRGRGLPRDLYARNYTESH